MRTFVDVFWNGLKPPKTETSQSESETGKQKKRGHKASRKKNRKIWLDSRQSSKPRRYAASAN
jgi:hypothetical protein